MKLLIYTGLTIGSILGTWIGSLIDHNPIFGPVSLLGGAVGAFIGIWAGYKLAKFYQ